MIRVSVFIFLGFCVGCASADYGYYDKVGNGRYTFYANSSAMDHYEYFLCSKKEEACLYHLRSLVERLIIDDEKLSKNCSEGFTVLDNTILIDENATTYVDFKCLERRSEQ